MKCTLCQNTIFLQSSHDKLYKISGEPVCKNCYFQELGNMMEKHPPGFPPYLKF